MAANRAANSAANSAADVAADARDGPRLRRPPAGRAVPVSTYRLQLHAGFTLDDAAARVPYLARLGVTHLYLSPILAATPGSLHGYDVVDHDRVSPDLGGEAALERLSRASTDHGLGLVLDIVPNHMTVPVPAWHNRALWSVLALGPDSPFADWFDVDWSGGDGALLMPVLGNRIGEVLAADEIRVAIESVPGEDAPRAVLRYFDHVLPVRAGTENLPLAELLERQHYRVAWWKVAAEELNYRRFFDVDTLAAIRVERPEVFDATHALVVGLLNRGVIDGLRIDHPDGLAAPKAYLERLAAQTDDAWVVVEKILAPDEELPEDWATAGTTGYDTMWRVHGIFVDPAGESELASVMRHLTGDDTLHTLVEAAKREVIEHSLQAEIQRLATVAAALCHADIRLRDHTTQALRDCLVELLVESERYRYYLVPGETMEPRVQAAFEDCVARARTRLADDRHATLDVLAALLQGHEIGSAGRTDEPARAELVVRFQQTCGPVMAKAVEDTTFYRWTHLIGLNEVGGAPERFAISPMELHAFADRALDHAPLAMTGLSTHDTKRSEDVRMRLNVLSECAQDWARHVARVREATSEMRSPLLDGRTENFIWQTLAGTWTAEDVVGETGASGTSGDAPATDASAEGGPLSLERLEPYLVKAMREAKTRTTWTEQDPEYEAAVLAFARAAVTHPEVIAAQTDWLALTGEAVRAATLGIKLVQLTLPGVADVYQGSEVPIVALVDPDNRRPVDYDALDARLAALDEGAQPKDLADEKLLVTSRALRLRRDHADAFTSTAAGYRSLPASTGNAFTFARTVTDSDGREEARVVVVATRLALSLARYGGWQTHTVTLPETRAGRWRCAFTGRVLPAGETRLSDLLDDLPVALLVADPSTDPGTDPGTDPSTDPGAGAGTGMSARDGQAPK